MHRLGIVVLALAAILVGGAPSASAAPGEGNGGFSDEAGYRAAAVAFSGDAAPGGGEVGPAWVQVVARTDGLRLSSPAGGASCGPDVARTPYAPGVDEKAACTVSFSRASVGYRDGYPVDASTAWTATWTGSGNTGGTLAPLQRNTRVEVPVAESQSVVIGAR